MAGKAFPFLNVRLVLLLLVPLPSVSAWPDAPVIPPELSPSELTPLRNDTYAYVGVTLDPLPGPVFKTGYCWRAGGEGHVQGNAMECWASGQDAEAASTGSRLMGRIVVGFVVQGESHCVAEIDGGDVQYPCCSREYAERMHCTLSRAVPGLPP